MKNSKEIILSSILVLSTLIVFITEFLSFFKALNFTSLSLFWCFIALLLSFILFKDGKNSVSILKRFISKIWGFFKNTNLLEKGLFLFTTVGLLGLLFQGIIYPPNNWDSLTYHMSRIMYWIGNESVDHFQSNILRHLYQPPFAEYFVLNINLLNGNDYLSNSVQWLFLVLSIVSIWGILDFFSVTKSQKILAAFLLITIPSVQLQSSTTKNDIVAGFFILTSLYFSLKSYYELKLKYFILIGFSIGLAMLTKGTTYLFLTPVLLFFTIFILFKIPKNIKIIYYGLITILIIISLNFCHFSRNYAINGAILNIDKWESETYPNSEMNGKLLVSNFLKNAGLHIGYPLQPHFDTWIREFHKKNNVNIDNPSTNFLGTPYYGPKEFETQEDLVPNDLHLPLIILSAFTILVFFFLKRKKDFKELLLVLILFLQVLLFIGYLKWQPWHTRLHIPMFMFSVVIIVIAIKKSKLLFILSILFTALLCYSFYFKFVYNNTRPIITNLQFTKKIKIDDLRFKKYFSNQLNLYPDYVSIQNILFANNPQKIGLAMADWEYPLFNAYYRDELQLISINVNNVTKKIIQNEKGIDFIISNTKENFIFLNGKKFTNKTPENIKVWIYQ